MVILLWLSLLAAISYSAQSPCDEKVKLELVPNDSKLKNISCGSDCHKFDCENDTLIYTPENQKEYKVELLSLQCNKRMWIAMEGYRNLTGKRAIYEKGTIQCKGNIKMSCSETRLEFKSKHLHQGSSDPNYYHDKKLYTCEKSHDNQDPLFFFYSLKFSFRPTEGYYLMDAPQCDDQSELTALFAGNVSRVKIPYYGIVTCKKFSCRDSNDLPLSWLRILEVDSECLSWPDCIKPMWHNTQFPCGQEGHELVVYRKKDKEEQFLWLKDHFLQCSPKDTIHFVDTDGQTHPLKKDDHKFICRLPPSCDKLMSEPKGDYGCKERSSCQSIDASLIPHSHLSSFDGRCTLKEHLLTIVDGPTSASLGWELSSISCKYGKWHANPAEGSRTIGVRPMPTIDKKTNFVCEGRADFLLDQCDHPKADCEVEVEEGKKKKIENICMPATKNASKTSIHCAEDKFHLVLRTKYHDGSTEKITRVEGDMTCDRRSRNWMGTNRPFLEAKSSIDKESTFVCAIDACSSVPLTSICTNTTYCHTVKPPKYWLNAACKDSTYYLLYSRKQRQTPEEISELHCELSSPNGKPHWTFKVNGNDREVTAEEDDNFYCSIYKSWSEQQKAEKRKEDYLEDTSPGCSPTKIDSICYINEEECLTVDKSETDTHSDWKCLEGRTMWYFSPSAKKMDEGIKVDSLKCSLNDPNDPFWIATKFNETSTFIPQPHSNFLCFTVETTKGDSPPSTESAPSKVEGKRKSGKKGGWPMGVEESIVIFTSLLIIIFSVVIVVWSTVKHRREQEEREKLK